MIVLLHSSFYTASFHDFIAAFPVSHSYIPMKTLTELTLGFLGKTKPQEHKCTRLVKYKNEVDLKSLGEFQVNQTK